MKKDWFTGSLPEVDEMGQPTGCQEDFIFHYDEVSGTTHFELDGKRAYFVNTTDFRQIQVNKNVFDRLCERGKEPAGAT